MQRQLALLGLPLAALLGTGCVSPTGRPDYTASGALIGGAIGGMSSWNSAEGAIAGALVGGIIGHGLDQAQEAQLRTQAPETYQRVEQSQPLTVADVKAMVQAGIGDDLVISQIRNSRTVFRLATADIIDLKNAGVSERVIDFMINTPTQNVPSASVAPPPPRETIIVSPGPSYVWVPGTWIWFGGRWSWRGGYWHRPMRPHGPYWR